MTPFHGPCPWIAVRPGPWPHPTHLLVARERRRLRSSPKFYDDTRGRNRYRGRERRAVSPCSYGICRTPARKLKIRLCYVRKKMLPVTGKRVSSWILHLILEPFFSDFYTFYSKLFEKSAPLLRYVTDNEENRRHRNFFNRYTNGSSIKEEGTLWKSVNKNLD